MFNTCGITCAHSLVVLKFLNLPLFNVLLFHPRWARVTEVEFDTSTTTYESGVLHPRVMHNKDNVGTEEHTDFVDESNGTDHDPSLGNTLTHDVEGMDVEMVPPQLNTSLTDNSPSKQPPQHK